MIDYTPTTEEVRLDYAPAKTFPADAEEQFDRWLAEVIRKAKEEAWDEGYVSSDDYFGDHDNPYRQGEEQ